jgi:hypothetical protein
MLCAALLASLPIGGCRRAPPAEAPASQEKAAAEAQGVSLKPEEIEKAGIVTAPAAATTHAPESSGYAVVLTRDTIAQAVADLTSAAAVARQSRAALERTRSLAQTPGAMPVESLEAAERQAAVDQAALILAQRRLSASFGANAPWKGNLGNPLLAELASGERKLARVTFPLGAVVGEAPAKLWFAHLGQPQHATSAGRSFESLLVWSAPADASIPGRSFFATLKGSDAGEGERLLARVPIGAPEAGVLVPLAATLISQGKYWCYIEERPGVFRRREVDASTPTDEGYFVKSGIPAGAKIVVASAGQLLARETNPSTAAD